VSLVSKQCGTTFYNGSSNFGAAGELFGTRNLTILYQNEFDETVCHFTLSSNFFTPKSTLGASSTEILENTEISFKCISQLYFSGFGPFYIPSHEFYQFPCNSSAYSFQMS